MSLAHIGKPPAQLNVVIIHPRNPWGRDQVYLAGSVYGIAAVFVALGHTVRVVDLNIDRLSDKFVQSALAAANIIGISVLGSAYIPGTLTLIPELHRIAPHATVLLGGQVIEQLSPKQFAAIYTRHRVVQVASTMDLAEVLGYHPHTIPSAYSVSYRPVFEAMGEERLFMYLRHEMALVVSQGCHFNCGFCAARKKEPETLREVVNFETDLTYLAEVAKRHGQNRLEFYASSLDFFQNPDKVRLHLDVLSNVRTKTGVDIRVRCLSCLTSFAEAVKEIPNLGKLARQAGLWCIGFGVDGGESDTWREQHKGQNTMDDFVSVFDTCETLGIRAELLMVIGFPKDTVRRLARSVWLCFKSLWRWQRVLIRPYMAKSFVPGNKGWEAQTQAVERVVKNPSFFYNLDFCATASSLTHPRLFHRLICNCAYLLLCSLTLIGKGCTSPILPQGGNGLWSRVAARINRLMPFDR